MTDIQNFTGSLAPVATFWKGNTTPKTWGLSDIGRLREVNQDSWAVDEGLGLSIVCDGMGGAAGGDLASQMAVQVVRQELEKALGDLLRMDLPQRRQVLSTLINKACLTIYDKALEVPRFKGMGTTCTFLWIPPRDRQNPDNLKALVAHVGDSRCYLLRCGVLYQITEDHSQLNEQIKSGSIRSRESVVLASRHTITRAVGHKEEEEVDTYEVTLFEGDRFLLCSDGLSTKINDIEISSALGTKDLATVPPLLVQMANDRGGEDNITLLVVEV